MDPFYFIPRTDEPLYRQITNQLRDEILNGRLPEGTRFPPISNLAKKWKTNYFTVQNALLPLANQGLIESRPRKGTFVCGTKAQLKTLGIYFGASFWSSVGQEFYSALFGMLGEQAQELNITQHLWIDHRTAQGLHTPLPALVKAVEKGEIQAVIASMLIDRDIEWLQKLSVPVSIFSGMDLPIAVWNDLNQMVRASLARLKERGCKSVGLISHMEKLAPVFRREAKKRGMRIAEKWIYTSTEPAEAAGSMGFKTIWSQTSRPDGLLVFPDVMARGVLLAMLEKQVSVPEDIKVIFHANAEVPFYCPLPVEWISTSIAGMAAALIASVQRQVAGKSPVRALVPLELQTNR